MNVAVLGGGTMGRGIAHVSARAGHTVTVRDVKDGIVEEALDEIDATLKEGVEREKVTPEERESALDRLSGNTDLASAVAAADIVIEAVPEDEELKKEVIVEAETCSPSDAVYASNTSSLSITAIASALDDPARLVGLHFFNPVHIMELVEIVVGERTAEETTEFAEDFVNDLDKTAIVVRDSPGFASSRLGAALGAEAMRMVQEGVASPRDVDSAMELGYNHPMGPLELSDIVGLDVRLDILEYLHAELGERFRPPQILKRKVRGGKLGKKSGEGFYEWDDGEAAIPDGGVA